MKTRTLLEWSAYFLIVLVPIAVLIMAFSGPVQRQNPATTGTGFQTSILAQTTTPRQRTAAIVDQVSSYNVNQQLITRVSASLVRAGYNVEVFSGSQVTVDLYLTLPSRGYSVIIFRVHSSSTVELGQGRVTSGAPVFLLTGEPYNALSYPYEQMMGQVRAVKIEAGIFFGIGPAFVSRSMKGTFSNTLIVLAGCESLANKDLAKAMIAKGASSVIGWSDSVGLDHNDKGIASLAQSLFENNLPVLEAVQATMKQIGKDPDYQSYLLSYP